MPPQSPAEKTAILMVALGEDIASELLRHMDREEVRRVSAAMSRIGKLNQETIDAVMDEFHEILTSGDQQGIIGGYGFTRRVLAKAFHESPYGRELASEIKKYHVEMQSLEHAEPEAIVRLIRHEHPQTIALIIAYAPASKSGRILKLLPKSLHTEIISRIAKLEEVDPEVVMELDEQLRSELQQSSLKAKKVGGVSQVAAIMNALGGEHQDLLDRLEERDPSLSDQIREEMFTFSDLVLLDTSSMRKLYQSLPQEVWHLALRGCSDSVMELVCRSLSERAAKLLKEDIDSRGPQRTDDIKEAQNQVLVRVRELEAQGEIMIERGEKKVV